MEISSVLEDLNKIGECSVSLGDVVKMKDVTKIVNFITGRDYVLVNALVLLVKLDDIANWDSNIYEVGEGEAVVAFAVKRRA